MEYRQPTQAEFIGDFVAKYRQTIRPWLLKGEREFVKVAINDLMVRHFVYLQNFHRDSNESPEINYQFAIASLSLLVDSQSTPSSVEEILTKVDGQIKKLEIKLQNNSDFQRQTREQPIQTYQ